MNLSNEEAKILIGLLLQLRKDVDHQLEISIPGPRKGFTLVMPTWTAMIYRKKLEPHTELLDRLKAEYDL